MLFFGKSMSRTRCTGALVESFRAHGVTVRWRNLATLRRWFGAGVAHRAARAEFRRFRPDVVFVFFRDLPAVLADEFRRDARLVIWCEEALEAFDGSVADYFALADLVCMSNPARFSWLGERGLDNMAFLMSGFSPRFHHPAKVQPFRRDVAFIGGPGRRGQRASFLARIGKRFHTEVFGLHWNRWEHVHDGLRIRAPIDNRGYARICASSRIVLGVVGGGKVDPRLIELLPGVHEVVRITQPYKLASRTFQADDTIITIGDLRIGGDEVIVIAGPCSAESEAQVHATDRLAAQADGGAQHEQREVGAREVERAHVRVEPLRDQVHDVREGLVEVVGPRDDLGDVRQQRDAVGYGSLRTGRSRRARSSSGRAAAVSAAADGTETPVRSCARGAPARGGT